MVGQVWDSRGIEAGKGSVRGDENSYAWGGVQDGSEVGGVSGIGKGGEPDCAGRGGERFRKGEEA